jgi:hypothetical protein
MGGEFVVAYLVIDNKDDPDFRAARAYLRKKSDKEILAELCLGMGWKEAQEVLDQYPNPRESLKKAIRDIKEAWEGARRDCDKIPVGDAYVLITGGMTYGDEPTDLYKAMDIFLAMQLDVPCGFRFN